MQPCKKDQRLFFEGRKTMLMGEIFMNIIRPMHVVPIPKQKSSRKNRDIERSKTSVKLFKKSPPNRRSRLKQSTEYPGKGEKLNLYEGKLL